ncbi:hypothetical protein PR048_018700 [Dryococelus australis]|uniref:Uncharacterized protein n=1 Tax=Dryococelus australis TaxID=614101 RepID=A0ABQ9HD01_9NEOP|nr:hypothetical protein PR048_018700 [Dryococelus australis]
MTKFVRLRAKLYMYQCISKDGIHKWVVKNCMTLEVYKYVLMNQQVMRTIVYNIWSHYHYVYTQCSNNLALTWMDGKHRTLDAAIIP